jgi:hypothetical protein
MRFNEALESGKRFKRTCSPVWRDPPSTHPHSVDWFSTTEILAADWEVEEERISLSAAEIEKAFDNVTAPSSEGTLTAFLRQLGFKHV